MGHFVLCAGRKSIKMLSKRSLGAFRQYVQIAHRSLSTSAARAQDAIIFTGPEDKQEIYAKIGNRDIVGHGMNGKPIYIDCLHYPCPAIRFKENTADVMALREKEKGDWKALTIDEKKALYRASFRSTYAEIDAPNGHWKIVVTCGFIAFFSSTCYAVDNKAICFWPRSASNIIKESRVEGSYSRTYGAWKNEPTIRTCSTF